MHPRAPEEAMQRFEDREQAGRVLAERLRPRFGGRSDVLVLALPRGGVPVGYEVAMALGAPLDVFLVRKLGVPGHEELAMGAIAGGGVRVMNPSVLSMIDVPQREIDRVARREGVELARRTEAYRGTRGEPVVRGRTVILVDDGLATGSTMRAAAAALKALGPEEVVVAVPVAARETCDELADEVDEVICLRTPEPFHAVGLWYDDFSQTTDDEVRELLDAARAVSPSGPSESPAS
jgi:predicted phosphoribosyltransferase